jgi:hypothetical protein
MPKPAFRKAVPRSYPGTKKGHRGQCGLMFKAGKFVGPGSGPYQICLSEQQTQELFGKPYLSPADAQRMKLGCGSWACVWENAAGRAVKITRDVDDIAAFQAAGVVKGVRVPRGATANVVKVYKQRELIGAGHDTKTGKPIRLWAQVAQQVDHPLPKRHEDWIKNRLCRMRISLLTDVARHRSEKLPVTAFKPSALTFRKVTTACGALNTEAKQRECARLGNTLVDTFSELYRRGVYWVDMNENNLGYDPKTRTWYGFDLGLSDVPLAKQPGELRGAGAKDRANDAALLGSCKRRR